MSARDVAVVGMSCVFPGASGVDTFWRNIAGGVDSIGELPGERWSGSRLNSLPEDHEAHVSCRRGGFIDTPYLFDPLRHRVMPKVAEHGDPDQFILLDVLADALSDAGIAPDHPVRRTTDVIVGRGNYTSNKMLEIFLRSDGFDRIFAFLERRFPSLSQDELASLEADMRASLPPLDPDGMATAITNLVASRAANRLDLGGAAFLADAACASSLIAVEIGVQRLRDGKCDAALACGVNFCQVPGFWYLFTQLGALSPSGKIRPFDRSADGMLIGEGAGAVLLKRVEDARRDGDRVYAIVKGTGSSSDGRATGVLAPASEGQVRALEQAYRDAGVAPDDIGLLEAHGTGTPAGDAAEVETIRAVFGRSASGVPTRVMGSVKSMIGHAMPAAGMASFIKTALAVSNKILPPSLHCEEPDPALDDLPFFVTSTARPWLHNPKCGPRRAAVNAFGFGGVNAHVVLEEVAEPSATTSVLQSRPLRTGVPRPSELLAFSASDESSLAARLRLVGTFLREEGGDYDLEDVAYSLASEADHASACRLGLVRPGLERLADELDDLARRIERSELVTAENEGVFFAGSDSPSGGRIAAVFPGIGFPGLTGDFPAHLLANCMHFPAVREAFDRVENRDEDPRDPLPNSVILVPPSHLTEERRATIRNRFAPPASTPENEISSAAPDERNLAHMGILVNNWASWQVLQGLEIPVDMLCGQSLGDLSAVLAAGMVDFEESIPGFWKAFNLEIPYRGSGSSVMVGTTEEELAPLLAEIPDVSIGIHLSPRVQLVGGSEAGTRELCARLRARNVLAQKLPFPPIHTPRLAEFQEELTRTTDHGAPVRRGRVTIYSAVLAAPMPDEPEQVVDLLRSNVSRPIRFWQTLHRMVDDGARFIVQIGSGTLAAGSRTILDRDDVVCVAMDVGHRHPLTQIQTMCGMIFAAGLRLNHERLFEARSPRTLDLAAPAPASAPRPGCIPLTLYWPPMSAANDVPRAAAEQPAAVADTAPKRGTTFPLLGRVEHFEPGRKIVAVKRLTLDEHPYLADHVFFNLSGADRPLRDHGAVVPLTFTIEMLTEAAACLAPGRGLVRVDEIRATRWIAFEGVDAVDVRVEATLTGADDASSSVRAEVVVDGTSVARATVHFATRYRQTMEMSFRRPTNPRTFPISAREVYDGRYFFHGPSFHCLSELQVLSDEGVTGEMVVPSPAALFKGIPEPQILLDPIALDGAGQVVGAFFIDRGIQLLPVSVDGIEIYRPSPPPGTRCPVRVEFTEIDLDARRSKANIEVQDGAGSVWFRVSGWQDVLFRCSPAWIESQRALDRRTLSTRLEIDGLPPGADAVLVRREDVRDVPPEWLSHSHLGPLEERSAPEFAERDPRLRTSWLLGRVAAKDAARRWLAEQNGTRRMPHPARVAVANDDAGRPYITADGGVEVPAISLAHGQAGAVAVAAEKAVGIDMEAADAGSRLVLDDFATERERALLDKLPGTHDDPVRVTRLWCAKEAAAKALGRGLGGRPKEYEAVEADGSGRLWIRHGPTGQCVEVSTTLHSGLLIAVGAVATSVGARPSAG